MCNYKCNECLHACKSNATDAEVEKLWEELEDVLFIEVKDFYKTKDYEDDFSLVLASNWQGWEAGTDRESIWHWFDNHHSKGIQYLMWG